MFHQSIQLWGDSIGKGVIYDESRKRYALCPDRCAFTISQSLGIPLENHARMGATVGMGLAEFKASEPVPGAIAAIEFGGNDCDLDWPAVAAAPGEFHDGRTPLAEFETQLTTFVNEARLRGMDPLLVTPPPLHAQRYFDWVTRDLDRAAVLAYLGDVAHIYRWQERYANAVRRVSLATGTPLFDLRDAFLQHASLDPLMCLDGIHPTAAGHQVIREAVDKAAKTLFQPAPRRFFDIKGTLSKKMAAQPFSGRPADWQLA